LLLLRGGDLLFQCPDGILQGHVLTQKLSPLTVLCHDLGSQPLELPLNYAALLEELGPLLLEFLNSGLEFLGALAGFGGLFLHI